MSGSDDPKCLRALGLCVHSNSLVALQLSRRQGAAGKQVARRYANTAQILEFEAPGWWPGDVSIKQRRHHNVTDSDACVATLIEKDDRWRYMGW